MKVALVHDYIKEYGGAERVLEALHELYPQAPVFTSVYLPRFLGPHRKRFENWDIRTSWLQFVPFKHKLISPFRLLANAAFQRFDFSGYDVIIVSASGAYIPNSIKKKDAVQICYCHTPPRYLYGFATARDWKKHKVFVFLATIANHFLRMTDYKASGNVDFYIANSGEVAERIRKFYRREATVIYPPVETSMKYQVSSIKYEQEKNEKILNTKYLIPNTGYFLTGGRLVRAKHVDLIIRACLELDRPLKVFGRGFAGYESYLKSQISKFKNTAPSFADASAGRLNSKIELLGEVSDEAKVELIKGAKAFLFASEDEDFGIVPVEVMACGIPVIAHRSGGVKETVIEGKTGVFFDELSVDGLKQAIRKFEKLKIDPEACIQQAKKFSKERFQKEILQFVSGKVQ